MVYSRAGILPSVTEKAYVISVNSLLSVDRACQGRGTHEILDVSMGIWAVSSEIGCKRVLQYFLYYVLPLRSRVKF